MSKLTPTPEQHIAALNARLRTDDSYRAGMSFVAYPEGASGDSIDGYSVVGSVDRFGVYARIAHEVAKELGLA